MQIDDSLILHLEKLARLKLSANERITIQGELNRILQMVDKLQEVDTENVVPLVYMNEEVNNVFREDVIKNQVARDEALKNAPATDGTYFEVPKVIK